MRRALLKRVDHPPRGDIEGGCKVVEAINKADDKTQDEPFSLFTKR
jgi:hypothetical protein